VVSPFFGAAVISKYRHALKYATRQGGHKAGWARVYPLVPWGDAGVSIIFVAGMFAMWKWPGRLQAVSAVTLAAVVLYVLGRGMW